MHRPPVVRFELAQPLQIQPPRPAQPPALVPVNPNQHAQLVQPRQRPPHRGLTQPGRLRQRRQARVRPPVPIGVRHEHEQQQLGRRAHPPRAAHRDELIEDADGRGGLRSIRVRLFHNAVGTPIPRNGKPTAATTPRFVRRIAHSSPRCAHNSGHQRTSAAPLDSTAPRPSEARP